ncbi:lysis inhibition regulator [Aeromonas phage Riv-10]|nr:lysis inhibition regulator [Aeromonas phage L9-6]APU02143.1 lysis inhibition regulator [Aeromonas phage Riv-10]
MPKIIAAVALLVATVHLVSANPEVGSYDEFMQGAMIVYTNDIKHSKDNSVQFLEYLDTKWGSAGCSDTCFQLGYQEAKLFVAYNTEVQNGNKIQ